jgi:7,8-dihydropterin-6-yl-methyl-4-(beta-D-ribofuranosyl)aminobenzene 5'-phosphate synthase
MLKEQQPAIKIIYNNLCSANRNNYRADHGFSAWIEFDGWNIMFDTGGDSSLLIDNLLAAGIEAAEPDIIVISHNHWDHVYGLPGILKATNNKPVVYLPLDSGSKINAQYPSMKYVEITEPREIIKNIWIISPMPAEYKHTNFNEQSLVLTTGEKLFVFVGCSHPGIDRITAKISDLFPGKQIENLIGGFHLNSKSESEVKNISDELKRLGVKNISPSHCTGEAAIELLQKEWGSNFIQLFLGDELKF